MIVTKLKVVSVFFAWAGAIQFIVGAPAAGTVVMMASGAAWMILGTLEELF